MTDLGKNTKNVFAVILMVIDFIAILFCGYMVAKNDSIHYGNFVEVPEDMHLTFKADTTFDEKEGSITIPKGTVIKPKYIYRNRIGFDYSTEGYSIEEIRNMDSSERDEKGVHYLSEKPESFVEYDEIMRLCDEADQQNRITKSKVFWKDFTPALGLGIVWLLAWCIFTWFLCRKQMYVVLYTIDIILIPVLFYVSSLMLYH